MSVIDFACLSSTQLLHYAQSKPFSANVMVEYSYEEALEFLGSKEKSAKKQLKEMTEDLAFVRNQIITCEVNISRIYNWDVRKRRIAGQ